MRAVLQAKERRTLAEVLPYACQLFPDDETLRLACILAVSRNTFADLRDKLERERTFSSNDIERLAALERSYVDAHQTFFDALPSRQQVLYGSPLFPKVLYTLEYSRAFTEFNCTSIFDTGAFYAVKNVNTTLTKTVQCC